MSPPLEVVADRIRMTLAEAGYSAESHDVEVYVEDGEVCTSWPMPRTIDTVIASWRAWCVVDPEGLPCWTCWSTGNDHIAAACTHPPVLADAPLPAPAAPTGEEDR